MKLDSRFPLWGYFIIPSLRSGTDLVVPKVTRSAQSPSWNQERWRICLNHVSKFYGPWNKELADHNCQPTDVEGKENCTFRNIINNHYDTTYRESINDHKSLP